MRRIRFDTGLLDGRQWPTDGRDDLRRQWERWSHLARFLNKDEQAFLEVVIEQGGRTSRLAQATGQNPTRLRRRMRDIVRRLSGSELQAMLKQPDLFSQLETACVREHLVRKRPLVQIAAELNISVYELRKTLQAVRAKARRLHAY